MKNILIIGIMAAICLPLASGDTNSEKNNGLSDVQRKSSEYSQAIEKWEKLSRSGKGLYVGKIKRDDQTQIVFFRSTNFPIPVSRMVNESITVTFPSVDSAAGFLQAHPLDVSIFLSEAVVGLLNDPEKMLSSLTDAERLKLGLPLRDSPKPVGKKPTGANPERKVDYPLFDWVRTGKLYWLDNYEGGAFQYRPADGASFIVSGNIEKIQKLIREEIKNERHMHDFLLKKLPYVTVYFFGKRSTYIVTRSHIKKRSDMASDNWPQGVSTETFNHSEALLKKYIVESTPVSLKDGKWTLSMNVVNFDGSVEKWTMDGDVFPFSISPRQKTVLEKTGTIVPLP